MVALASANARLQYRWMRSTRFVDEGRCVGSSAFELLEDKEQPSCPASNFERTTAAPRMGVWDSRGSESTVPISALAPVAQAL